jgi:hypothetical protein
MVQNIRKIPSFLRGELLKLSSVSPPDHEEIPEKLKLEVADNDANQSRRPKVMDCLSSRKLAPAIVHA